MSEWGWTDAEFRLQYDDTRKHFEEYAKNAPVATTALLDFVKHVMETLRNDTHGAFMLGYVRGMLLRAEAELREARREAVRWEHDAEADAYYVYLRTGHAAVTQEADGAVDYDAEGNVIGFELLTRGRPDPNRDPESVAAEELANFLDRSEISTDHAHRDAQYLLANYRIRRHSLTTMRKDDDA